jgi:hypothetical protein
MVVMLDIPLLINRITDTHFTGLPSMITRTD